MNWRDEYLTGSFRGASFRSEGHERSGGRRVAIFEFPGRDEPLTEDLGRRQRQFSIDCHVVGTDYRAARDALIDALEQDGPGLLVHPWHGQMMVNALEYTSREDQGGGICSFTVTFAEAGQPVSAPVAAAAGQQAAADADALAALAPAEFASRFSIENVAAFVENAAGDLISGMVDVSRLAAGLQGGIGPTLRAFDAGLRYLPNNLSSLLRAPVNLAHSIAGLVGAVALLGNGSRPRLVALTTMLDWTPSEPAPMPITITRQREADNRDALLWLFHSSTAGELVRVASSASYSSYEDAVTTRDAIADRLDQLAIGAADRGDDTASTGFDRLRRAVVRDIAARVPTLARLYEVTPRQTEPALAIANRLYGATGAAASAAEIVARNNIAHPGFVPGGSALKVLSGVSA